MANTFCLLKPDAVRRGLIVRLLVIVDHAGLVPVRMELVWPTRALAREHYRAYAAWKDFADLIEFTCSGPVLAMVLAARHPDRDAVVLLRRRMGPYRDRVPGTIREMIMLPDRPYHENLVHGSDSAAEAEREATLWFGRGGLTPLADPDSTPER
jgi:nucleoside-diphosphate kinase